MKAKRFTVGRRIGYGLLLIVTLNLFTVGFFYFYIRDLGSQVTTLTYERIPLIRNIDRVQKDLLLLELLGDRLIVESDIEAKAAVEREWDATRLEIGELIDAVESHAGDLVNGEIAAVRSSLGNYCDFARRVWEIALAENSEKALDLFRVEGGEHTRAVEHAVETAVEAVHRATERESEVLAASTSHLIAMAPVFAGVVLIVAFATGYWTTRGVNRSLREVASGLKLGAGQVASASMQVFGSSQTLASGASQQAASIEETGASLEEISSMTKRNSESAKQAKELSNQARSSADRSGEQMEEMRRAMDAINNSSNDIAKIIKTIDEIAFQTNILALNAAVEAARAGESGAGFAVVADEVRALAQRSAKAAQDTATLIEDARNKSVHGVEISDKVAVALEDIVEKTRRVDTLVSEIATANAEQDDGISQITTTIGQMDSVTQNSASSAEETASTAQELSRQAELMEANVKKLLLLVDGDGGSESLPSDLSWMNSGGSRETRLSAGRARSVSGRNSNNGNSTLASDEFEASSRSGGATFFN